MKTMKGLPKNVFSDYVIDSNIYDCHVIELLDDKLAEVIRNVPQLRRLIWRFFIIIKSRERNFKTREAFEITKSNCKEILLEVYSSEAIKRDVIEKVNSHITSKQKDFEVRMKE